MSTSISALSILLKYEQYAEVRSLQYEENESEKLMSMTDAKRYLSVPPVTLEGTSFKTVPEFKYNRGMHNRLMTIEAIKNNDHLNFLCMCSQIKIFTIFLTYLLRYLKSTYK